MNYFRMVLPLLLACNSIPAAAVTLTWSIPAGERMEMTRTAQVKFLVNDRPEKTYEERNIIDLTCTDTRDGASRVQGIFTVYRRDREKDVFRLEEQYTSGFEIGLLGHFTVPKQNYMPNLRNIPAFPGRDVKAGDTWSADAELVFNIFSKPFKLTFPVLYGLKKLEKKGDSGIAEIQFDFLINMDLAGGKYPADFPVKILGKDEGTLYWDISGNHPVSMREKYRIIFFFPSDGKRPTANEFRMIIDTSICMYKPVTREQKEEHRHALEKEVPSGIDVDTDKRGLVLRLGDVLFDFDFAGLREESRAALYRIAGILAGKYPDREIIVEGHTDATGGADYNLRLSRYRAETVARYLRQRAGTEKLSYRGFGPDRPIAGNDTGDGRQKNRRVEIIIKLQ